MKRTTVIAVAVALVIGLAGSATAASLITSKDIKNGTIKTADLSSAAKRALKGKAGPRGSAGPQGATGPAGPAGPTGVLGQQVVEATLVVAPGDVDGPQAFCPAGKVPVGTGYFASITHPGFVEVFGNSVGAGFINDSSIPVETKVQAICAGAGAVTAAASSRARDRSAFRDALRDLR